MPLTAVEGKAFAHLLQTQITVPDRDMRLRSIPGVIAKAKL